MAENWAAIAAEVDAALKSVGSTDAGFSATLMQSTTTGGEPWDPTGGTTVQTYSTVTVVQGVREIRDRFRLQALLCSMRSILGAAWKARPQVANLR